MNTESLNPKFSFLIEGRNKIQDLPLVWEDDIYEVSKTTGFLDNSNGLVITPPSEYDRILIYTKGENTDGIQALFLIDGKSVIIPIFDFFTLTCTTEFIGNITIETESVVQIETVVHFFKKK